MEPIYDPETGELIGYAAEADDGSIVFFDDQAETIVAAQDPQSGEWLDPSGYEISADDDQPGPYAHLDQRLDALEYQLSQPRPLPEMILTRGLESADVNRIGQDMSVQAERLETALGRPLLIEERRRLAEQVSDDIDAGDARPDLFDAAAKTGGLLDLDSGHRGRDHVARVDFMTTRMADQQRATNAAAGLDDVSNPEPPAQRESYDLDDREQRQAYYDDRLRGATDASAGYSSSDFKEDWET